MAAKCKLTPEELGKLKNWVAAGLSRMEVLTLAHHDGMLTDENYYEIENVLYFKLKAEAKFERGKTVADAALENPDHAMKWLTHVGGWAPAKPIEFTGWNSLEAVNAFLEQLQAHKEKLLAAEPQRLLEGKKDESK